MILLRSEINLSFNGNLEKDQEFYKLIFHWSVNALQVGWFEMREGIEKCRNVFKQACVDLSYVYGETDLKSDAKFERGWVHTLQWESSLRCGNARGNISPYETSPRLRVYLNGARNARVALETRPDYGVSVRSVRGVRNRDVYGFMTGKIVSPG